MTPLLSTAFCPPIEYFAVLAGYSSVYMEACESYAKQSWRNRCRILTSNGPMDFSVPIIHDDKQIKTIKIEYDTPWIAKFRRAVESAYGNSPYYIYYADEFWKIFDEMPETLWKLNLKIIIFLCSKIGIAPEIIPTSSYYLEEARGFSFGSSLRSPHHRQAGGPPATEPRVLRPSGEASGFLDLREVIHPKRENNVMAEMGVGRPYWQVFREKFGFVGGLSVLDLLFNEGPESLGYLR